MNTSTILQRQVYVYVYHVYLTNVLFLLSTNHITQMNTGRTHHALVRLNDMRKQSTVALASWMIVAQVIGRSSTRVRS
jgi:hypothetical protein